MNKSTTNVSRETFITMDDLKNLIPIRERICVQDEDKEHFRKVIFWGILTDYIDNDFDLYKKKVKEVFSFNNDLVIVVESEE